MLLAKRADWLPFQSHKHPSWRRIAQKQSLLKIDHCLKSAMARIRSMQISRQAYGEWETYLESTAVAVGFIIKNSIFVNMYPISSDVQLQGVNIKTVILWPGTEETAEQIIDNLGANTLALFNVLCRLIPTSYKSSIHKMALHFLKSISLPLAFLAPSVLATANITLYPSLTTACDPFTNGDDLTYLTLPADGTCHPFSSIGSFQITGLDEGCWSEGLLVFSNQACNQEDGSGLANWGWSGEETCTAMSEGSFEWNCLLAPIGGLGHGW